MRAKFGKAKPEQARLKTSIYGPPGSGKTFTTLLMAEGLAEYCGKRIAYVDTERGTDFYAKEVTQRKLHPKAFDFDALYTRSLKDVIDAVNSLSPKEHGVVIIDSISHLWEAAMDAYTGRRTKADSIPMHAWGKIKKPYKKLINDLISGPYHVFILGRQKNLFENDPRTESITKVGVAMRAEGETPYEPHMCFRMECIQDSKDTTQSKHLCYVEKDRTGVLDGRTITNPTFATIEPLLPLLGDTQAQIEDEDDRSERDAELHAEDEEKAKAKADKSRTKFSEASGMLQVCGSLAELDGVAKAIKKNRRGMLEEHTASLRQQYLAKREELMNKEIAEL
jgi:hypothetical protein